MIKMLLSLFVRESFDVIYDCSHPAIRQAQHLANLNNKAYVLMQNIIGGIDIVPSDKVEDTTHHFACITPQPKHVAWVVREDQEGTGCIVFHHHGLAARRKGANQLGCEFDYVDCKREPKYDLYADSGKVPVKVLVADGWWWTCTECQRRIEDDEDEGDELTTGSENIIEEGSRVFCCQQCRDDFHSSVAMQNEKFESFKVKIAELRPDLEFTDFSGAYPSITLEAKFKFAGCKYGGSVRDQNGDHNLSWFVTSGDQEAWAQYEQNRKQDSK